MEERNLLSVAYGSIAGDRHAAWRIIASDEQKEKFKGIEQQASHAREHVAKVEGEIQKIRDGILALMDENLIPSSSTGESKEKGLITCVVNRLQTSTDLKGFDMMTAVRRFAEQGHSAALAQLGSHISAIMKFGARADDDPFVNVKDLTMDFSRLQAEASSETNQKSHCDEETSMATEKEDLEDDTAKHSSPLETAVPDAYLTCDTKCKVANETCVKDNMFMITGEITVAGKLHHETDVRGIVRNFGIDSFIDDLNRVDSKGLHYQDCEVLFHVNKQRADIAESLHVGKDHLDHGAQENHCLDKVVDVPVVMQRTVGSEHQPRISRISAEVDVPVYPGRLAPCERVQKRRQHEQQHKPQQQTKQTMQARKRRQREEGEKGQEERERGERGKKEKGHEAVEERDKEVKKDVTDWTVVTRNRRQRKMIQIFVKVNGSKTNLTDDKVEDMLRRIQKDEDVYVTMHGRVLKRSVRLKSCEVTDGCTIQVSDRLEGEDTRTKETERKRGKVQMQVDRKINKLSYRSTSIKKWHRQ